MYYQGQDTQARIPNIDGAEILDEIITRSRGEIRLTQSAKVTSSTPTLDIRPTHSLQASPRKYSPHVIQLSEEQSPRMKGKELEAKQTPSAGPSIIGQSPRS